MTPGLTTYARAGLGAIPGAGKLPFLAGGGGEIPETVLELETTIDTSELAEYCRVCGFPLRETLPATYPHVLAFGLHMDLLLGPDFPLPAIGLVHVANRITQRRPIAVGEDLSLKVRATKLEPHPKGRTFALITEATVGDELVWDGESTNLRRGGGSDGAGRPLGPTVELESLPTEAEWRLPGDLGRRYAAVSGDRNPIHLYGLTAKAFGFPRQIAHGMWTKARSLAQLDARLPDAFTVDVAFKRPILLPGKVEFKSAEAADGGHDLGVASRSGEPHLAGTIRPA